jgi:hypothetical protein
MAAKIPLRVVPMRLTAATITTEIRAETRPYSMTAEPDSSLMKQHGMVFIGQGPSWREESNAKLSLCPVNT